MFNSERFGFVTAILPLLLCFGHVFKEDEWCFIVLKAEHLFAYILFH